MKTLLAVIILTMAAVCAHAQTLSNFSARIDIVPGGNYIIGFAVPGPGPVNLFLRAVGTPLESFGVTTGISRPSFEMYNSAGQNFMFGWYDAGPDFVAICNLVGAFQPTPYNTGYAWTVGAFNPGAYTVSISNDAGVAGTVLFEVYVIQGNIPQVSLPLPYPVPPQGPIVNPSTLESSSG